MKHDPAPKGKKVSQRKRQRHDMAMQSFTYPKPDNGTFFESLCLKIFRVYLNLPHLAKFGRQGHAQQGIDLIWVEPGRVLGIQCKLRNSAKRIKFSEIEAALQKAKNFDPRITELILVTSAQRDPVIQAKIFKIIQDRANCPFKLAIYFWEDIEEILKQNPTLASELYPIPSTPPVSFDFSADVISGQVPTGAFHAEIDVAAERLAEQPEVALALLNKLRRERWDSLTPRERFRLVANIGNAELRKGDTETASRAFLEAANFQPEEDDNALSIAAHGHLLGGDTERAYTTALAACQLNPLNERAQMIMIASAPPDIQLVALIDSVPQPLRKELNIILALASRAMDDGDAVEAERILRLIHDDSAQYKSSLGAALLEQAVSGARADGMPFLRDSAQAAEARKFFTAALDSPDVSTGLRAASHFNRGLASVLLGESRQALTDFRLAHQQEPNNKIYATALIEELFRQGDATSALSLATDLYNQEKTPVSRLLLSTALFEADEGGDREQSVKLLKDGLPELDSLMPEMRIEYLRRTLQFLHASGLLSIEESELLVDSLSQPLEKSIIRTRALLMLNLQEAAKVEALETVALIDQSSRPGLKREVALLLVRLNLLAEALPIWLAICPPTRFSENTVNLLQTALGLGEDEIVFTYCDSLRSNGIFHPEVAEFDCDLLVRYNELQKAHSIVAEYLTANPAVFSLQVLLLHIAVLHGWRDLVNTYMPESPLPKEIETVIDGVYLVQILGFRGLNQEAVELAYELVRRFPDDPRSHRALIVSILSPDRQKENLDLAPPQLVAPGSAVRLRRGGEGVQEWIVIEDSERPEVSRGEYPPDHALSRALIGSAVGDVVDLPARFIRPETGTIEEIKSKFLFRMHDSLEHMNRRFPGSSFFEKVSVGPFDESAPTGRELDDLIDLNRKLAEGPSEAEALYKDRRFPVTGLALAAGKEIPEVMEMLARHEKRLVHCVDGTAEEFERARGILGSSSELVLDLSALSTISLLGDFFDLSKMAAHCIVSEGTLEVLKKLAHVDERISGYLGFEDGRLVMQEVDIATQRIRSAQVLDFVARVEKHCEILGGRPLARLDSERRNVLVRLFGPQTAESIAIAKEHECALWTDDYVTGVLVQNELSIRRVWTQVVSLWLREANLFSDDTFDGISAHLCEFNYQFTSISSRTIVVACRLCGWNPEQQPLRGVLDRVGELAQKQDMMVISASVIPLIWKDAPILESAARVTLRLLDKLSSSVKGLSTIRLIVEHVDRIFGVNVIGAQNARRVLEAWLLASEKGGAIIES